MRTWHCGELTLYDEPELDGRGSVLADPVLRFVQDRLGGERVRSAFEWCCGPGYLGFTLLEAGVCEHLTLADVNPDALTCVARTVRSGGLADRVSYYVSDNFADIPEDARFDLVVANPPNFARLNPLHPAYERLRGDLRPSDPGWRIHRSFYAGVGAHLRPGARLFISEVEPHLAHVHDPVDERQPWDLRERPALADLVPMVAAAGLMLEEVTRYHTGANGVDLYMMVSRRP